VVEVRCAGRPCDERDHGHAAAWSRRDLEAPSDRHGADQLGNAAELTNGYQTDFVRRRWSGRARAFVAPLLVRAQG